MNQYQKNKMLDLVKRLEQISKKLEDLGSTVQLLIEKVSQKNYKNYKWKNYDSKGH